MRGSAQTLFLEEQNMGNTATLEPPLIEDTQFGEAGAPAVATTRACHCPCPCKTSEEMVTNFSATYAVEAEQGDP